MANEQPKLGRVKLDHNRRDINLQDAEVAKVLPEYFRESYPQLLQLLNDYYEYINQDAEPGGRIKNLQRARDIVQVPSVQLEYLEDELLLGKAYFEGWLNKREALKFSNTLYKSKGTLYGVQQFFKAFYGIDADVAYTKDLVLKTASSAVDEDGNLITPVTTIGPDGARLTDDTIYQELAIQIKVGLSPEDWLETYKLIAHPAGMYISPVLQIVSVNENTVDTNLEAVELLQITDLIVTSSATLEPLGDGEIVDAYDSDGTIINLDVYRTIESVATTSLSLTSASYNTIEQFVDINSATLDDDNMTMDTTVFETIDGSTYQ